jgi:hypothetical protein
VRFVVFDFNVEIGSEAFLIVFISLELNEDKKKTKTGRTL